MGASVARPGRGMNPTLVAVAIVVVAIVSLVTAALLTAGSGG